MIRTKAFGHESIEKLYNVTACKHVLEYIDRPFLIFNSKDDPVCLPEDLNRGKLLENSNCLLIEAEFGGHCAFMSQHDPLKYRRFYLDVIPKYIEDLDAASLNL